MTRRYLKPRIPRDVSERLHLAAAVAAAQVLDEHVAAALEVVREGASRAPVDRLLAAYGRLHQLDDSRLRQLRERTLAALGRAAEGPWTQHELEAPRSPWRRLTHRLRGRIHHDLREWMERHTARVRLAVIDLHVRHALAFVRILNGHTSSREALELYAGMMHLDRTSGEVVRLMALRTLHETRLQGSEAPLPDRSTFPLRVADSGG